MSQDCDAVAPPLTWEPVSGIEPLTCRLQEVRSLAPGALAAPMARVIALMAPVSSPHGRLIHVWSAGSPNVGLSAWELACHALPTTVFAAQSLCALPVSARYRPPQTVASGTQRA